VPRSVDAVERRHELTEAAARLIAQSGIGAATMRGVATEAGWSTGALTHYFADKRELLLATLQTSLRRRRDQGPAPADDSPGAVLHAALAAALPLDDDSRRHWMVTVAFCAEAAGDAELAAAQQDAYRQFLRRVTRLVGRVTAGAEPEARRTAERLIALIDGVALQALFDPASWPAERQLAALDEELGSL